MSLCLAYKDQLRLERKQISARDKVGRSYRVNLMSGLYKSTSLWQFQTPIKQIKFAYGSFDKHASMASFKTTHV